MCLHKLSLWLRLASREKTVNNQKMLRWGLRGVWGNDISNLLLGLSYTLVYIYVNVYNTMLSWCWKQNIYSTKVVFYILYIMFYAEYNIKFTYIMLYIFRIPTLYMWMCVTLRMHLKHNTKRAVLETPPGIFGRMRSLSKIYFHVCDFECRIIFTSMLSSISMYQQHWM